MAKTNPLDAFVQSSTTNDFRLRTVPNLADYVTQQGLMAGVQQYALAMQEWANELAAAVNQRLQPKGATESTTTTSSVSTPATTSKSNTSQQGSSGGGQSGSLSLTLGNLTESGSSVLQIVGGSKAVIGNGVNIQVFQAGAAQSGYLSSTDWTTFNGKLGDAPSNGSIYARQSGNWVVVTSGGGGGTDVLGVQIFS